MMGIAHLPNRRQYWTLRMFSCSVLSYTRYFQIKRFLHISMPEDLGTGNIHQNRDWWKKVEPLNTHMQLRSQAYLLPGTHVSIDEVMVRFAGRSQHMVRMPRKPISVRYKVMAICSSSGYEPSS